MASTMDCTLSICIATFNRAKFIEEALESVLAQVTPACEIVVTDNASSDGTEQLLRSYERRYERLRYVRHPSNKGLDYNFDSAVMAARGRYCWLLSDDDVLKPGAVKRVLDALEEAPSLVLANYEFRDFKLGKLLQPKAFGVASDCSYSGNEVDRVFIDLDDRLWFIGVVIVRRDVWLARERERYYGLLFIHIAVLFQQHLPGKIVVLAQPLVTYRMGNTHSYTGELAELLLRKWPHLAEMMQLSGAVRRGVRSLEPWNQPRWLLVLRGWGVYSHREYRQWIRPRLASAPRRILPYLVSLLPGVLVNAGLTLYYSMRRDRGRELQWMRRSPFNLRHIVAAKSSFPPT
jgi:abequosyltransferase